MSTRSVHFENIDTEIVDLERMIATNTQRRCHTNELSHPNPNPKAGVSSNKPSPDQY